MVDKIVYTQSDRKALRFVILATLIIGLIAQIVSYYHDYVYAYPDSISRADIARRFYDSLTPGISQQLGTAWLPIPAIVLLPFNYIDYLWHTGLGGSIVNLVSFVLTACCIFLSIRLITSHRLSQYLGTLIFVINPNILYLQTTAMSEIFFLMLITAGVYYLMKWNISGEKVWFMYASIIMALAVGSRYEGWTYAIVCTVVFIFLIWSKDRSKVLRYTLVFIAPTVLFVAYWLYHNYTVYGDPFAFIRGEFSASAWFSKGGRYTSKDNIPLSIIIYVNSVLGLTGGLTILLSIFGVVLYGLVNKLRFNSFAPYIFLSIAPVTVLLLYLGNIIIELPNIEPYGYYNARYSIYIIPGMGFFIGYLSSKLYEYKYYGNLPYYIGYFVVVLIIPLSLYYNWPKGAPVVVETAFFNNSRPEINRASEYLRQNYDGGNLFYDGVNFALKPYTKIPIKNRVFLDTWDIGPKTLKAPQEHATWILLDKKNPYNLLKDKVPDYVLEDYYDLVYIDSGIEIYKLKPVPQITRR